MIKGDEGLIEFESLCSDSYSILIKSAKYFSIYHFKILLYQF